MSSQRMIINISVPPIIAKEIKELARVENKTSSELLREAFRSYKASKQWTRLRMLGEQTAQKMGIESYDDVEKIAG